MPRLAAPAVTVDTATVPSASCFTTSPRLQAPAVICIFSVVAVSDHAAPSRRRMGLKPKGEFVLAIGWLPFLGCRALASSASVRAVIYVARPGSERDPDLVGDLIWYLYGFTRDTIRVNNPRHASVWRVSYLLAIDPQSISRLAYFL